MALAFLTISSMTFTAKSRVQSGTIGIHNCQVNAFPFSEINQNIDVFSAQQSEPSLLLFLSTKAEQSRFSQLCHDNR
jgi:hypothetical protein